MKNPLLFIIFEFLYYLLDEFLAPDCLLQSCIFAVYNSTIVAAIYTREESIDLDDEHRLTVECEVIAHPDSSREEVCIRRRIERKLREYDMLRMVPELELFTPHIDGSDEDCSCRVALEESKLLPLAS